MPVKKVVFVSTVFPFPVDSGKKVVVSGILKYLVERYGAEQVTYILLGSLDERSLKESMPCEYLALKRPSALHQLWNVSSSVLLKRAKSIQELMFYSAELGRELRAIVARIGPDLIICDTFRTGQFFETTERVEGNYILYMDDLFSVRYQKMLEVLTRFPRAKLSPLGNFARFIPSSLRPFVQLRFVQKQLLRLEQSLVEKRERECVKWFDSNLLINTEEANLLQRETSHPSVQTVKPLLRDTGRGVDRRYNSDPVFVFLGALNLPHNQFSITHFIETQMDKIIEKIPGVRLRVIGRGESKELLRLAEKYKGIVSIEGFVDDLDTVFSESCAMIVPLLFGSGVKIKTLEALARGLPVISTDFGVEGIPVASGVNCIVENDINQYPQLMRAVVDIDYNLDISRKAHDFYLKNYSEERVFQEYGLLFGESTEVRYEGSTSNKHHYQQLQLRSVSGGGDK